MITYEDLVEKTKGIKRKSLLSGSIALKKEEIKVMARKMASNEVAFKCYTAEMQDDLRRAIETGELPEEREYTFFGMKIIQIKDGGRSSS